MSDDIRSLAEEALSKITELLKVLDGAPELNAPVEQQQPVKVKHYWKGEEWQPHPDATRQAATVQRFMSVDDYIDHYLLRCKDLERTPRSGEWLAWFLRDDSDARQRERIASRRTESGVDDTGTPIGWS